MSGRRLRSSKIAVEAEKEGIMKERYSRDFNIRVIGVAEQDCEDCLSILQGHFTLLDLKMTMAKLRMPTLLEENARRNLGILLPNSITDLSSVSYFVSLRIRKTSKN